MTKKKNKESKVEDVRYSRDPEEPNSFIKGMSGDKTRYVDGNLKIDSRTYPKNQDFAGKEYVDKFIDKENKYFVSRDRLIDGIIEYENMRKEYIRRLIVEESRLDILMKLLNYEVPPHQMVMNDFLSSRKFAMVLAPRGSGKSTACTVCYTILEILKDPNVRIMIASRALDQSKAFLKEIKHNLQKESLTEIFGELKGDKWDETQISVAGRTAQFKEHTLTIAGADGTVVSKHFNIIICDDIVDKKNSRTETTRTQVLDFFYTSLIPTLEPGGHLRMVGTRYNPEDIYGYLKENDDNFKDNIFTIPALYNRHTGEAADIEEDTDGNITVSKDVVSYDPIRFPKEDLLLKRTSMPISSFECQFMNRTEFMEGTYFKESWIGEYDDLPENLVQKYDLRVWTGVDLAISDKEENDEFAIVTIGVSPKNFEIYLLDYLSGRYTINQQKHLVGNIYDEWKPLRVFIESNAYQAALAGAVYDLFPHIPTMQVYTTKDKVTRALSIQPYFERRKVFFRRGRMRRMIQQLIGFPDHKLKDLFDALFFSINGALQKGARKKRKKEFGLFGYEKR